MSPAELELDAVIFGGGAAGLWLLDELHRRSFSVLLVELRALGAGQTIASQGILHGGLKYTLTGSRSSSSDGVREMPALWKACLEGRAQPDLRGTTILSTSCHLWRTDSLTSWLGLTGARVGLRTPVEHVAAGDRPAALAGCPGEVYRVDEPVIDVASFLRTLADRHAPRLIHVGDPRNAAFEKTADAPRVHLQHPGADESLSLKPNAIILTAGEGNEALRRALELSADVMQRRPLHQVMVRGPLPELFGHCVDGSRTRVTVTSARDAAGRTVWYLGGELSERGVHLEPAELIAHARGELMSVLPGVDLSDTQWATLRINRAEGKSPDGRRPEGSVLRREGAVISAWPTKLVLVPRLATMIADELNKRSGMAEVEISARWPRPLVAKPPWEQPVEWRV